MTERSHRLDTGTDVLLAEVIDGVGVITLNRPERRNALSAAMYPAIRHVLDMFAVDGDVGCVLLTGAGSAFCAGGDIRDGAAERAERRPTYEERVDGLLADSRTALMIYEHPKVVLAALPGAAVGAGLSLALVCDLRIAARRTKLITGWGRLALSGDFGGPWCLTRLLGPAKALEVLIGGEPIGSDEAKALGLLNRVVDDDDLAGAAMDWARQIAHGPTLTYRYMKANIRVSSEVSMAEALPFEVTNMVRSSLTFQHGEAIRAIEERRAPKYR